MHADTTWSTDAATWSALLLLGIGGAPHCAAMCGALTLLAAGGPAQNVGAWRRALCHASGRAFMYALLGFALALAWRSVHERAVPSATEWRVVQVAAAAFAASVMLGSAARQFGFAPRLLDRLRLTRRDQERPRGQHALGMRIVASVRAIGPMRGAFGLGLLNALLPCGLSWGALLLAAQATPLHALGASFVFGALTAVGPLALFASSRWIPRHGGRFARSAAAVVFVAGACLCAWRGVSAWRGTAAPCCAAEPTPSARGPNGLE